MAFYSFPSQSQQKRGGIEGCCSISVVDDDNNDNNINNNNGQNLAQVTTSLLLPSPKGANIFASTNQSDDEKILIQELNNLTFEEREKIYDEIHGVAKVTTETPELLESCLCKFQTELTKLSRRTRKDLERAYFLKPSLKYDKTFMIMFLRADNYDPFLAANRMAQYFTNKLELFGDDKLVKDITLEDLSEDDMECLKHGTFHVLKEKDRSGRTIIFSDICRLKFKNWTNLARSVWYQMMCAIMEDEATQIHGLVDIIHFVDLPGMTSSITEFATRSTQMITNLPYRTSAFHICYNDHRLKPTLSFLQMLLARYIRLRLRAHFGSNIECLYALMTFGIPRDAIPIHTDGTPIKDLHEAYLANRQAIEKRQKQKQTLDDEKEKQNESTKQQQQPRLFDTPQPNDVLLGRGRPYQVFSGNRKLVTLVDAQRSRHKCMDRLEKTNLSMEIVKIIQSLGGRFLLKTDLGWEEVNDQTAREKVSQTFRTKLCGKKQQQQQQKREEEEEQPVLSDDTFDDKKLEDLMGGTSSRSNKRVRYDDSLLKRI